MLARELQNRGYLRDTPHLRMKATSLSD